MLKSVKNFFAVEDGVSAIEYGLIAALIAVAIYIAVQTVGTNLTTQFNKVATEIGSK